MTIDEEIHNLIERANKLADRLETKREMTEPAEKLRTIISNLEDLQTEIEDIGERDDDEAEVLADSDD